MFDGRVSIVIGHWSLVIGHWSLASGFLANDDGRLTNDHASKLFHEPDSLLWQAATLAVGNGVCHRCP